MFMDKLKYPYTVWLRMGKMFSFPYEKIAGFHTPYGLHNSTASSLREQILIFFA